MAPFFLALPVRLDRRIAQPEAGRARIGLTTLPGYRSGFTLDQDADPAV